MALSNDNIVIRCRVYFKVKILSFFVKTTSSIKSAIKKYIIYYSYFSVLDIEKELWCDCLRDNYPKLVHLSLLQVVLRPYELTVFALVNAVLL